MIEDRDVDLAVRDLVREDVELSGDGLREALDRVAETPQVQPGRRWWPFRRARRDPARRRGDDRAGAGHPVPIARVAAAGVVVALVAFVVLIQLPDDDAEPQPAVSPSPSVLISPAPTESAPTESATPSPDRSPTTAELPPATITVDEAGSGDFETIAEAVEAAVDGDVIEILPGIYEGGITIEKDIAIRGDPSDGSAVLVRVTEAAPASSATPPPPDDDEEPEEFPDRWGFRFVDSTGSVGHVSVEASVGNVLGFDIVGGAPTIHDVTVEAVEGVNFVNVDGGAAGVVHGSRGAGVGVNGGATTLFEGNDLRGEGDDPNSIDIGGVGSAPRFIGNQLPSVEVGEGSATFEDNDMLVSLDGCAVRVVDAIATATFRGNRFSDPEASVCLLYGASATLIDNEFRGGEAGVSVQSRSSATIDGNTFTDVDTAVFVEAGTHASIVRNRIERGNIGIQTSRFAVEGGTAISNEDRAQGFITDNTIIDAGQVAIELDSSNHQLRGNAIEGGPVGISIFHRGSPVLEENSISRTETAAITVRAEARPWITDTRMCGNAVDVDVAEEADARVERTIVCDEGLASPAPTE